MNSTSKVKCVLCHAEVEEPGQDACASCRQATGEQVDIPDEPITKDICPNCGKEAEKFVMGLCTDCVGAKPMPKPKVVKVPPMEQIAQALEAIGGKMTKKQMLEELKVIAERVRQVRKDTEVWMNKKIAQAKAQAKAQPKAGPKDPEKVIGVCPKCQGTGKYLNERTGVEGVCFRCKGDGQFTEQDRWDWDGHPSNPERKPLNKTRKVEAPTTNPNDLDLLGQVLIKRLLGR